MHCSYCCRRTSHSSSRDSFSSERMPSYTTYPRIKTVLLHTFQGSNVQHQIRRSWNSTKNYFTEISMNLKHFMVFPICWNTSIFSFQTRNKFQKKGKKSWGRKAFAICNSAIPSHNTCTVRWIPGSLIILFQQTLFKVCVRSLSHVWFQNSVLQTGQSSSRLFFLSHAFATCAECGFTFFLRRCIDVPRKDVVLKAADAINVQVPVFIYQIYVQLLTIWGLFFASEIPKLCV